MENDKIAVGQLLVAHELEIRALKIEIDTLRSQLKSFRADFLATLKHARPASKRGHRSATTIAASPTDHRHRHNSGSRIS
jgi:hypothetical protein